MQTKKGTWDLLKHYTCNISAKYVTLASHELCPHCNKTEKNRLNLSVYWQQHHKYTACLQQRKTKQNKKNRQNDSLKKTALTARILTLSICVFILHKVQHVCRERWHKRRKILIKRLRLTTHIAVHIHIFDSSLAKSLLFLLEKKKVSKIYCII